MKAELVTTDPDLPTAEWDRLTPQAETTLNLLRATRANSRLSTYAYIFEQFDFNATAMAPPGTKVTAHLKPVKYQHGNFMGIKDGQRLQQLNIIDV